MNTNDELVDYLIERGDIETERIEEAFRKVDRAEFVDKNPYADRPSYLEEGSTVSAPHMVAQMLEILQPHGKILEMGSGSGYVLALLTELAEDVTGVERIERLVEESREKVPEAKIILGDTIPDENFNQILYSFATEDIQDGLQNADTVVVPEIQDHEQVLKKYDETGSKAYNRVRFVGERRGFRGS